MEDIPSRLHPPIEKEKIEVIPHTNTTLLSQPLLCYCQKGIATRRAQGFLELRRGRATQRAQANLGLRRAVTTQRAQGFLGLQKGRDTHAADRAKAYKILEAKGSPTTPKAIRVVTRVSVTHLTVDRDVEQSGGNEGDLELISGEELVVKLMDGEEPGGEKPDVVASRGKLSHFCQ